MIIIYCLLGFVAIVEFATFITYDGFVSKQIADLYMNLDESKLRLNLFAPSILDYSINKYFYIAKLPFSILSKYHIQGLGAIPRWSKLHKRVNEYFVIACENSLKK
jgi:predicted membrane channel-forming protein YqfA (hemolysin III family)